MSFPKDYSHKPKSVTGAGGPKPKPKPAPETAPKQTPQDPPYWTSELPAARAATGAAPVGSFAAPKADAAPAAASGPAPGASPEVDLARTRAGAIQGRVDRYHNDFDMGRSAGRVRGQDSVFYVQDEFPPAYGFEHEGQPTLTHFTNHFHVDTSGPDRVVSKVVALENYKSPGLDFFASDVLLSQLAAAANPGRKGPVDLLRDLPAFPPRAIVRDTIDNQATKAVLKELNPGLAPALVFPGGSPQCEALLKTPNGKATLNFLKEYNALNQARNLPAVEVESVAVYKTGAEPDTGWKLQVNSRFAEAPPP